MDNHHNQVFYFPILSVFVLDVGCAGYSIEFWKSHGKYETASDVITDMNLPIQIYPTGNPELLHPSLSGISFQNCIERVSSVSTPLIWELFLTIRGSIRNNERQCFVV